MPNNNETPRVITPEAEQVARSVRSWLNTYPDIPEPMVDVDFLGETAGLAIMTTQAAYKTHEYICGGYEAQYQFMIYYRTIPTTANERLIADEVLNNIATWAERNLSTLTLDDPCVAKRIVRNTNAALLGQMQNGAEDHTISMTLRYEVNV